ncbi:ead/Ea22-like family protein [Stutzerimonas stutzeri]|uniref:Ead/Ea22-like family protein n=1 Tax=Stutzerimonas stutzeri TaxID=316 RepID=A0A172WRG7_STUST|nr:ead/Ea22-like family protein [Stutzerimonas stutzeri]ANF26010.1 hypothetical protein PS273GM_13090 [Stutzerimonas stutzeri]
MNKYDELKRLAEATFGQNWRAGNYYGKPFIASYQVLADTADGLCVILEGNQNFRQEAEANAAFVGAANPATVLELIAENERLQADKNTVDCRFEVSRDTLEVIRGCLRQAESEIDQMKAQSVERGAVSRALHEAVSAIYFDDSSDFGSALWAVVRHLAPELIEELESDPSAVWHKTEALAEQESSK